jgi:hypothetical protein
LSFHFNLITLDWHRQQVWPAQLLKNRLKNNAEVTIPFMKSVSHIHDDDAIGPWITSIFDVPRASPEWDAWTVDLSYCQPCLLKFLEEHVWKWFLIDRVKGAHLYCFCVF